MKAIFVGFPPRGELTKGGRLGVNRTVEGSDRHFVIIARINHDNIILRDQIVPIFSLHIVAHSRKWINIGLSHRHDFTLQTHFNLSENLLLCKTLFPLQTSTTRKAAQVCHYGVDASTWTSNRSVDPFVGEQDRALHVLCIAQGAHGWTQCVSIFETGEMV